MISTAVAPLREVLEDLRLEGAIFFRSEFTEAWAYESPPAGEMAAMLRPGAQRLIMFHVVAAGTCWVSVGGRDRYWASRGDVVVLPYGDQHRVGGTQETELVEIASLFDPPPWDTLPVVRHGTGGDRTDLVCGYLHSEHPLFDPSMRALPPVLVVHPKDAAASAWVNSSIDYALGEGAAALPAESPSTRIAEALLVEVLRTHLASAPAVEHGWIAALGDPVLAPALAEIHRAPQHRWTVDELARHAAVSRSVLDERFRQVLGRAPIRYLADWRMHRARELLGGTDLTVAEIAHRIGYDSEEAFSRAFKRHSGDAPTIWRNDHCRR